jgi:hypothetical protein
MPRVLSPHPDSNVFPAVVIAVEVVPSGDGLVLFSYVATGDVGAILLPPTRACERHDGLWRHTCFEAFVRPQPGDAYYEFNFAPSTQWATYRFRAYRSDGEAAEEAGRSRIDIEASTGRYALRAEVDLRRLRGFDAASCRIGLSAVIEDVRGRLSYWALAHPAGKPDFHHAVGFVHALDLAIDR